HRLLAGALASAGRRARGRTHRRIRSYAARKGGPVMNADDKHPVNATAGPVNAGALPVRMRSRDVEHVGPVLDGELIDDTLPQPRRRAARRRFARWWQHSPRVPLWLRSKPQAIQAAKDAVVWVLKSPFRYLGAVVRGVVVGARWWRGWVKVHDYRTAAEESDKLADKFTEIRELTLFRW